MANGVFNSGSTITLFSTTLTISGSGNSGIIDMSGIDACWLSVFAQGASTGTAPTLNVYYDQQDAAANLVTGVVGTVQLTSGNTSTHVSFGHGIGSLSSFGGGLVLSNAGRVQWVVGGTASPTFPNTTISLLGRVR